MQISNPIKQMLENTDVVILCGGMGSRLRSVVNDRPKPMAEINRQPFLDILIDYFSGFGFRRFILCAGHKSEVIRDYYTRNKGSLEFIISDETSPLGTAGSIKNAEKLIRSDPFLVANGDSFCRLDLIKFYNFHCDRDALISMAVIESEDTADGGQVLLDDQKRIVGFEEKKHERASGFINAGIYLFQKEILSAIPSEMKYSLECDVFPKVLNQPCYAFLTDKNLIDIGTPQRLAFAEKFFLQKDSLFASNLSTGRI